MKLPDFLQRYNLTVEPLDDTGEDEWLFAIRRGDDSAEVVIWLDSGMEPVEEDVLLDLSANIALYELGGRTLEGFVATDDFFDLVKDREMAEYTFDHARENSEAMQRLLGDEGYRTFWHDPELFKK